MDQRFYDGLWETTLAQIMAAELGSTDLHPVAGTGGDLAAI
ncbi:MAG: hypothetical protein ACLR7Z_11845 [Bilophila wadsworthia]